MSAARHPRRALLAVVAASGLLLVAGLLPAFSGAAPAGDLAREVGRAAGPVSVELPGGGAGGAGGVGPGGAGAPGAGGLGGLGGLGGSFDLGGDGVLVDGGGSGGSGSGGAGGGPGGVPGGGTPGRPVEGGPASGSGGRGSGGGGGGLLEAIAELFTGGGGGGGGSGEPPAGDGNGDQGSRQCHPTNGYEVCLPAGSLTPGQVVRATVRRGGEPAAGVPVRVNGRAVGRTDDRGRVAVPVPYAAELRVAVGGPSAALSPRDDRAYALAQQDGGVTLPVRTDVSLVVETTDPDPGEPARVRATVGGNPAPGMEVFVDGTAVGVTRRDGRAAVTLPAAREATIRVEQGDVTAERTVTLFDPAVRTKGLVALPGSTVELVATEGGEPLSGGTVTVDGAEHRLDENGTASAALPTAPTADLTVRADGAAATVTKQLWLVPAGAGLLGLGALVAVGVLYRRSEATGRTLLAQAAATLSAAASALLSGLVALAANAEDAARAAAEGLREFLAAVEAPDLDPAAVLRAQLAALLALFDPRPRLSRLRDRVGGGDEDAASGAAAGPGGSRGRVEAAWAVFVARVGVARPSRRTPGEVAEAALSAGFPRRPVERLTEAFRAVEYADADPDEHAETAERAASELEVER